MALEGIISGLIIIMTGLISSLFNSKCMSGLILYFKRLPQDFLNFKMLLLNFRFEVFGLAR